MGRVALEKKSSDVVILEVGHLTSIAGYFVFCSGNSERQVNSIAEAIQSEIRKFFKDRAAIEGTKSGRWVLLDYGDIIVHIFHEETRAFYGIENMWRDANQILQSEYDTIPAKPALVHQNQGRANLSHKAS